MLSFFEMFHLLEGFRDDFQRRFNTPPPATPTGTVDPLSNIDQTIGRISGSGKKRSGQMPVRGDEVRVGNIGTPGKYSQGGDYAYQNQRDRELGQNARSLAQTQRTPDVSYINPIKYLQDKSDYTAVKILKAIQANPKFQGQFSLDDIIMRFPLYKSIGEPLNKLEYKQALHNIAGLPEEFGSPIKVMPGNGGSDVYVIKQKAKISDPGESDRALPGRYRTPSQEGGFATPGSRANLPKPPEADAGYARANLDPNLRSKERPMNAGELGKALDSTANRFTAEYERVMDNLQRYTPEQLNQRPQLAHSKMSTIRDEYMEMLEKLKGMAQGPERELAAQRLATAAEELQQMRQLEDEYDQAVSGIEAAPRREWRYYVA